MAIQKLVLCADSQPASSLFRARNISKRNLVSALSCAALLTAISFLATSPAAQAAGKPVKIVSQQAGATPFISLVTVTVDNPASLDFYRFTIQPKEGSQTRPVSARYSAEYLKRRGFLQADSSEVTLPVFGLYAGYANKVALTFGFVDGRSQDNSLEIQTEVYTNTTYTQPTVVQARTPNTTLSYDFFLLKNYSDAASPIFFDTDGQIRWVGVAAGNQSSILYKNSVFIIVGGSVVRMELDGEVTFGRDLQDQGITNFHHNFDYGRDGIIMDVDTATDIESDNIEIDTQGNVLHRWNFADIIRKAMVAGGDDPKDFVNPPNDWFHNNATTYRASDNTLISSSRENFVIAVNYDTSAIRWILGGTKKKWYQYASLRKYALKLGPNTVAPIGQHAVSMDKDRLLLFDNGYQSLNNTPMGKSRKYSAPRMYKIDTAAGVATQVWSFPNGQSVFSPICSSVYSDRNNNYLIDYTTAGPYMFTKLVGVDASGSKVFDYQFTARDFCGTGWNAVPIHLEDMVFN